MPDQNTFSPFGQTMVNPFFGIFVVIFILVAIFAIVGIIRRQNQISTLRQSGKRVTATISKIDRRHRMQANATSSTIYYIIAVWQDPETQKYIRLRKKNASILQDLKKVTALPSSLIQTILTVNS